MLLKNKSIKNNYYQHVNVRFSTNMIIFMVVPTNSKLCIVMQSKDFNNFIIFWFGVVFSWVI